MLALAAGALSHASAQVGPFGSMRAPAMTGIAGWILAEQAQFYRALATLIHTARTDGSAAWALMGVSFIYGIFHAAGPGHGKAVISSYLVANEETWRRGIVLSFAAALLQAVTAILLVTVAALILGATAKMMSDTVKFIEIGSYALIVLLGARLTWVKGRGFIRAWHAAEAKRRRATCARACPSPPRACCDACDHHDHDHHAHRHGHDHDHDHDDEDNVLPWGHAHGPEPEELAGPGGWRRGLSAIVAVGLRPVLRRDHRAGVRAGAGPVLGRRRLDLRHGARHRHHGGDDRDARRRRQDAGETARRDARRLRRVIVRGLEVGAAFVVVLFGVLLLTGMMASERMGMF